MPKSKEVKSIAIDMPYDMNLSDDRIRLIREETARAIAAKVEEEILKVMKPNYFEVATGWIHQPGIYRFKIDFSLMNELMHRF